MTKIIRVIDLATHLGFADIDVETRKIVRSGNLNLSKETIMEKYVSSQCRKKLPKGLTYIGSRVYYGWTLVDDPKGLFRNKYNQPINYYEENEKGFCLVKEKKVVKELTLKEQLETYKDMLESSKIESYELVMEQPPITSGRFTTIQTISKLYMLYGITRLVYDKVEEVNVSTWFNWIVSEYPPLVAYEEKSKQVCKLWAGENDCAEWETKTTRKKLRKETSMIVANQLVDWEVKDDNEADAICLAHYWIENKLKEKNNENTRKTI